jgi:predicted transcriptional regulator
LQLSKEQQYAIEGSLVEMKAGKLLPHDEVLKKYQKWQRK